MENYLLALTITLIGVLAAAWIASSRSKRIERSQKDEIKQDAEVLRLAHYLYNNNYQHSFENIREKLPFNYSDERFKEIIMSYDHLFKECTMIHRDPVTRQRVKPGRPGIRIRDYTIAAIKNGNLGNASLN